MEIIKLANAFKKVNALYKFSYLQIIVWKDDWLYTTKSSCRELNLSVLCNIEPLEAKDKAPKVKPTWAVLDSPNGYYVKILNIWAYNDPNLG